MNEPMIVCSIFLSTYQMSSIVAILMASDPHFSCLYSQRFLHYYYSWGPQLSTYCETIHCCVPLLLVPFSQHLVIGLVPNTSKSRVLHHFLCFSHHQRIEDAVISALFLYPFTDSLTLSAYSFILFFLLVWWTVWEDGITGGFGSFMLDHAILNLP